jgi:hypothetical protein
MSGFWILCSAVQSFTVRANFANLYFITAYFVNFQLFREPLIKSLNSDDLWERVAFRSVFLSGPTGYQAFYQPTDQPNPAAKTKAYFAAGLAQPPFEKPPPQTAWQLAGLL